MSAFVKFSYPVLHKTLFTPYSERTMQEKFEKQPIAERNDKLIEKRNHRRHVKVWKLARVLLKPWMSGMMGFSFDVAPKDLKGPYIVLSNHNSNFDSIMIGLSFPQQMYYIASEQVYRAGFKSKLLKRYLEPISKIKGASDVLAVAKALRKVRNGYNLCLFPEGNRSFNGKTYPIMEATGKLVKVSGAGLVTYRIEGGYLASPRWSTGGIRKGKTYGHIVKYYSPEELKAMSVAEVTQAIRNDISENAFDMQDTRMIRYKGKKLAEGMECAVCVCPKCQHIDVIRTKGNSVSCTECGHLTDYNEYGYFDDGFTFKNVTLWDKWQENWYENYINSFEGTDEPMFVDHNCTLSTIDNDHSCIPIGNAPEGDGTDFQFYKDRIVFSNVTIMLKDITAVSVFGHDIFCFTDTSGTHYELRCAHLMNARKYTSAMRIMFGLQ